MDETLGSSSHYLDETLSDVEKSDEWASQVGLLNNILLLQEGTKKSLNVCRLQ